VKGRWAAGIVPRNFSWIIRDHLAVSERPGGYAPNHRKVRRQEEILWLRGQGFDRVVSLLASTHNLHAYDELGITWSHFPFSGTDLTELLSELYPALAVWLQQGQRVLLHQEELGDRLIGIVAGYLRWRGLLPEGERAIAAVEQIVKRQMETAGRSVVALVSQLAPYDPAFAGPVETAVADGAAAEGPAADGTAADGTAADGAAVEGAAVEDAAGSAPGGDA
jgi:hypothetical protein